MNRIYQALRSVNYPLGSKSDHVACALEIIVNEIAAQPEVCRICEQGDGGRHTIGIGGGWVHYPCLQNARNWRE